MKNLRTKGSKYGDQTTLYYAITYRQPPKTRQLTSGIQPQMPGQCFESKISYTWIQPRHNQSSIISYRNINSSPQFHHYIKFYVTDNAWHLNS